MHNTTKLLSLLLSFIAAYTLCPAEAMAKVTGTCATCHIMHNSQNGAALALSSTGTPYVGWNGDEGELAGGSNAGAQANLTVTSCVGCHTSSTDDTIVTIGSTRIPIVFNTVTPTNHLAGGNFYWLVENGDAYGHNVYGISGVDNNITLAEGAPGNTKGCNDSCHYSLGQAPELMPTPSGLETQLSGCQGCHINVFHHTDHADNQHFRFLNSHTDVDAYVSGVEDPDWEQDPDNGHNQYKGDDRVARPDTMSLKITNSMNGFCNGCHMEFHGLDDGYVATVKASQASPWLRHPTDLVLPESGEYNSYNPETDYNPLAPVGWLDLEDQTRKNAVVMCISCHRPHGSPYPDMLRWDYDTCSTGTANAACGCFVCHTEKD